MEHVLIPHIANHSVKAFFTLKTLGTETKTISEMTAIEENRIILPIQRHTDAVLVIEDSMLTDIADAVVTAKKNVMIGVQTADCVPILLFDKEKQVIGAVHAGWRGTAKGIVKKTVGVMKEQFRSSPQDIFVALGPSIRWNCYCVGPEVKEAVSQETGTGDYYRKNGSGTYALDLSSANITQIMSLGIPESNIWISDECTFCNPERYYSYRYSKSYEGNQGGFIGIV
jgi:YfiH family protein